MQTAFAIRNVNVLAELAASESISLTVDFQVHGIGPAYVAGLVPQSIGSGTRTAGEIPRALVASTGTGRGIAHTARRACSGSGGFAYPALSNLSRFSDCISPLRPRRTRTTRYTTIAALTARTMILAAVRCLAIS